MRPRPLLAAVAAGLLLASCGSGAGEDVAGDDPLDFVAPDVRGGEVAGADYAGQDLVIWFWAPW